MESAKDKTFTLNKYCGLTHFCTKKTLQITGYMKLTKIPFFCSKKTNYQTKWTKQTQWDKIRHFSIWQWFASDK